jgi:hypothetical protein
VIGKNPAVSAAEHQSPCLQITYNNFYFPTLMQFRQEFKQDRVRSWLLSAMRISGGHQFILAKFSMAWRAVFSGRSRYL